MAPPVHSSSAVKYLALAAVMTACTGTPAAEISPTLQKHAPSARPGAIALPGDGHGAIWDAKSSTLYITDNTHSAIVRWTDAGGFAPLAAVPLAQRVALGGIVRAPDGRLLVTSFGFGEDGGVIAVGDRVQPVPRLDPARRRLAIAQANDALYVAYFAVRPGSKRTGGVARLDVETGETDAITTGLVKPVGLAATATTLYVADADQRAVYAYPLDDFQSRTVIAKDLTSADLLTVLPNGDLVTGGGGDVQRITTRGAVSSIASGFEHVRGTAYDGSGHRLFVVEHSAASSSHTLHILPLRVD